MRFNKFILTFFISMFIVAYIMDVSKVAISYAVYYYDYYKAQDECFNEKPDMFQSNKLYLKALVKRVKDICPDSKPKPPKLEDNNMLLYINKIPYLKNNAICTKLKNRFVYKFSYDYQHFDKIFHPPLLVA